MAGFTPQELKKLSRIWIDWLLAYQAGKPSSHAAREATFKGLESDTGRSWKSYEYKCFEFSACAVWLGFGPVLGFPGCPTQKDWREPVPPGIELTPEEIEKLKDKKGRDRFMRWHGPKCAAKQAVISAAKFRGLTIRPLERARKGKKNG